MEGFSIVDETEVDAFLEFPCFFYDPANVGNLISDFSDFSESSLNIYLEVQGSCTVEAWLGEF